LIPPDRVARFLQGAVGVEPPYAISLSLPSPGPPAESARVIWTRMDWSVRGERRLELAGGVRHVHVRVDLGGPGALLERGALVVVLDVVLLAAVWLTSVVLTDGWRPRLPLVLAALRTGYRARQGGRSTSATTWCWRGRRACKRSSPRRACSRTNRCGGAWRTWHSASCSRPWWASSPR